MLKGRPRWSEGTRLGALAELVLNGILHFLPSALDSFPHQLPSGVLKRTADEAFLAFLPVAFPDPFQLLPISGANTCLSWLARRLSAQPAS